MFGKFNIVLTLVEKSHVSILNKKPSLERDG